MATVACGSVLNQDVAGFFWLAVQIVHGSGVKEPFFVVHVGEKDVEAPIDMPVNFCGAVSLRSNRITFVFASHTFSNVIRGFNEKHFACLPMHAGIE
jgi:hypothetical protein